MIGIGVKGIWINICEHIIKILRWMSCTKSIPLYVCRSNCIIKKCHMCHYFKLRHSKLFCHSYNLFHRKYALYVLYFKSSATDYFIFVWNSLTNVFCQFYRSLMDRASSHTVRRKLLCPHIRKKRRSSFRSNWQAVASRAASLVILGAY